MSKDDREKRDDTLHQRCIQRQTRETPHGMAQREDSLVGENSMMTNVSALKTARRVVLFSSTTARESRTCLSINKRAAIRYARRPHKTEHCPKNPPNFAGTGVGCPSFLVLVPCG